MSAAALSTARLLRAARLLSLSSIALTLFARNALEISLGLIAFWLAVRIEFDARIFDALAEGRLSLDAFDSAALALRIMPKEKTGRPLELRCRGAPRLVLVLGAILVIQFALRFTR